MTTHADHRHATRNMTQQYGLQVLASLALGSNPGLVSQIVASLGTQLSVLKFSRDDGEIIVRAARRGNVLEIRVEDEGIGIPPADLPHIFERFYRVEKARSRDSGGTGLGLSIVKHIVGLHGGSVRAESALGQGTAIVLSFSIDRE